MRQGWPVVMPPPLPAPSQNDLRDEHAIYPAHTQQIPAPLGTNLAWRLAQAAPLNHGAQYSELAMKLCRSFDEAQEQRSSRTWEQTQMDQRGAGSSRGYPEVRGVQRCALRTAQTDHHPQITCAFSE